MTRSSVLMFLDADDWIAPDYLEQGLAGFDNHRIAVVYSDVHYEGDRTGQLVPQSHQQAPQDVPSPDSVGGDRTFSCTLI